MVTDHVSNLGQYAALGSNFATAVRFVQGLTLDALAPGHYDVDGDRVFANVVDRELGEVPADWEMHQKYADIHLILSGSEAIGYYPASRLKQMPAFNERDDFALLHGLNGTLVPLEAGEFMIALPQDVHMPNHPGRRVERCKKLIVKVLVGEG